LNIIHKDLSYRIVSCGLEVHKTLGCGFLEYVYHDAFEYELKRAGLMYEREKELSIFYKDIILNHKYRIDFLIEKKVLVEIKAISQITNTEEAVTINYLQASTYNLALLINFGEKSLKYKRYIHENL
jgi:GxxExxY protein